MANVEHSSLSGSSLHEPKGAASASANAMYQADGVGSGSFKVHPVGVLKAYTATIAATAVAASGTVAILSASSGEQYKVREIFLSGDGTSYDAGGDRVLNVQDSSGASIYTAIPAAALKSIAAARWGDSGTPFPAAAEDLFQSSAAGETILAVHSGGASDYASGSLTITIIAERVA